MAADSRLARADFPRAAQYQPAWQIASGMGANPLWLAEWLTATVPLKPGMRVLDLGCGRASSSIFLAREFGVQVWATDLWISASENSQRIRAAGLEAAVFPLHADARALPFAGEFFDAIVCLDSYSYYGTDALYLNYLAHFVKIGGRIGIAGAGLVREFESSIPEHLKKFWTNDCWGLHSAEWWRRHWERTAIVDIELADHMTEGWQIWQDWYRVAHPQGTIELQALEADRGEYLGYIRVVGRRRGDAKLEDYCWPDALRSFPLQYEPQPLLRADSELPERANTTI